MVRTAAATLALILLPGIAQAQERAVHRVVDGETLWDLAQRYYSNPYGWPRIYEANRGVVENAHWIYPGEELVIPDVTATAQVVQEVVIGPVGGQPAPAGPMVAAEDPERSIFYQTDGPSGMMLIDEQARRRLAVPRDVSFSAPWLGPLGGPPPHLGVLSGFSGADDALVARQSAVRYDRIQITFVGAPPARGTELMSFRVDREIPGLGQVLVPTGLLSVSDPTMTGAVALVVDVFDFMTLGDYVTQAPTYALQPGVTAVERTSGAEATVLGYAREHDLQSLHDIVFLDQGSDHGVTVGDEYVVFWQDEGGWPAEPEGRLQVVAVHPDHASARIVHLRNPVFTGAIRARPDRKMP